MIILRIQMSHLRNVFNLDSFVEISALGRYKGPNITKYDTVCLSVDGQVPERPREVLRQSLLEAKVSGCIWSRAIRLPRLCTSGILEQNCFLVRREHIRMNRVHTSVRSVLLEFFSGSCYQSEMAAIKCEICPTDMGLHYDNLAIKLQCPKLASNRI